MNHLCCLTASLSSVMPLSSLMFSVQLSVPDWVQLSMQGAKKAILVVLICPVLCAAPLNVIV